MSPLSGGRGFTASELRDGGNVVMVNDRFARDHWPGENAVGKRIKVIRTSESDPWLTIVGVLPDVKQRALTQASLPEVFVPYSQPPFLLPDMDFVVRAAVPLAALGPALRQAVWNLDEGQPIEWQATMSDRIQTSVVRPRFYLVMVTAFATTAVLLAVSGIYAVVTYTVEQRRREVGIRLALGGSTARVLGPLMRQTTAVVAIGLATGVTVAILTSRALTDLLFDVTPLDFPTFAGAAVLLGLTGLVAGFLPARRATRIGIAQTLRVD